MTVDSAPASVSLALMIGNSRLHWAIFQDERLAATWDTPHLSASQVEPLMAQRFSPSAWPALANLPSSTVQAIQSATSAEMIPVWLASVVPSQTGLWQSYPAVQIVQAHQLPITGLYATMGCDRILALWGAGQTYGWPVLVVDGGTALTFTAASADQQLLGGAIAPGLRLQFQALAQHTAALPDVFGDFAQHYLTAKDGSGFDAPSPPRWAANTPNALQSGVFYSLLAGVQDYLQAWWAQYPQAMVVFTGGDGQWLWANLRSRLPSHSALLYLDADLIFKGIQAYRSWSQV